MALAPEVLLAVLGPHLEAVDAALAPGLGLLTWTSLNIDGYLHSVHQARMQKLPTCPVLGTTRTVSQGSEQIMQQTSGP